MLFANTFTMIILIIGIIYVVKSIINISKDLSFTNIFSKLLVSLILFNTCASISLGVNYYQPRSTEGIGRYGLLTPIIISQDYGWSYELYYDYFARTLIFTVLLIIALLTVNFLKKNLHR